MVTCTSTHPLGNPMKIPWKSHENGGKMSHRIIQNHPMFSLVGGFNLPLCKMMDFVTWDDFPFPIWWESHNPFMFQITNQSMVKPWWNLIFHGGISEKSLPSTSWYNPGACQCRFSHFIATWCAAEPQRRKDSRGSRGLVDGDFAYPKAGGSEQTRNGDVELIHVS